MSWFRIEGKMPQHEKIGPLSDAAFRLHITAGAWCAEMRTDGRIPKPMAAALTRAPTGKQLSKAVKELVDAVVWEDHGDYYELHDFLDWNISTEEYASKATAGAAGGKAKAAKRLAGASPTPSTRLAGARDVLKQNASKALADSDSDSDSDPDPDLPEKGGSEGPDRLPEPETTPADATPPNRGKISDRFAQSFDTEAPDQLEFTDEHREFARLHHFRLQETWLKCRDKRRAKGYRCANWNAEFMAWMRQELEWERERAASRPKLSLEDERGREDAAKHRRPTREPRENAGAYLVVKPIPGPAPKPKKMTAAEIDAELERRSSNATP